MGENVAERRALVVGRGSGRDARRNGGQAPSTVARSAEGSRAAITRLSALSDLDTAAVHALERAIASSVTDQPRSELLSEGQKIGAALLVVEGWAARMRILPDGRRQFLSFLLPGDLVGMCQHERAISVSTVVTITPVETCRAPDGEIYPSLQRAYAVSKALEEAHLLAQITRLGRLSALERLGDVMLELLERLTLSGQARNGTFNLPLTQEMLSDVLGLTPVHVNRMVQQARRLGWFEWRARRVTVNDPLALAAKVGRVPVKVQG